MGTHPVLHHKYPLILLHSPCFLLSTLFASFPPTSLTTSSLSLSLSIFLTLWNNHPKPPSFLFHSSFMQLKPSPFPFHHVPPTNHESLPPLQPTNFKL